MLNIPQLTGLFEPQPYVAPKDALENNISTIGAMQDPAGTLQRMQAEQIAKSMADLKMEGVDAKYKGLALDAINDYQNKSMQLYKGNKGFNRLSLDAKQLLQEQTNYKGLLGDINALKELTATNKKALEEVDNMMYQQILTVEDRNKFMAEIEEAEKNAKTIGDVPNYRAMLVNFMSARPQKAVAGMYKTPEGWADLVNKPQGGERAGEYDIKQAKDQILLQFGSGEWQQSTRPMLQQTGVLRKGMSPSEELDAAVAYAQGRFNPAENRKAGGTTIYNQAGGKDKLIPREIKKGNDTYYNFSAKPVSDSYGEYTGKYTTVRVEPDGTAWAYLKQIVNGKGEPVDVNEALTFDDFKTAGARSDPNKNGGIWLPYNDQVEWALQANDYKTDGIKARKGAYSAPPGGSGQPVVITPEQSKKLTHASTIIVTPDGDMTIAKLKVIKGLDDNGIKKAIEDGVISFK